MAKATGHEALQAVLTKIDELTNNFDVNDPEDVQLRVDSLISAMVDAKIVKDKRRVKGFHLDVALANLTLPLKDREKLAARSEMFHDLIGSYGEMPDEAEMVKAMELFAEIAENLTKAINAKMEKGTK